MRLMQMERELQYVRSDRDRLELYLTRIMKEVDRKVWMRCVSSLGVPFGVCACLILSYFVVGDKQHGA